MMLFLPNVCDAAERWVFIFLRDEKAKMKQVVVDAFPN